MQCMSGICQSNTLINQACAVLSRALLCQPCIVCHMKGFSVIMASCVTEECCRCFYHVGMCRECIDLLKELDAPVKHIIVTTHAYEHKVFIAPFQRRFPEAKVYVPPK